MPPRRWVKVRLCLGTYMYIPASYFILIRIIDCISLIYIPYPRERGPMGGAPYIGARLGGGPIFKVSV